MAQDPGTFDLTITDRIGFVTVTPKTGGTGDFDRTITDRLTWQDFVQVEAAGETLEIAVMPSDFAYWKDGPAIIGSP